MKRDSQDVFISKMKLINPNITILSEYQGDKGKVQCKCNICGNVYSDIATHLKAGRTCGNCKKLSKLKTNAQLFLRKSAEVHNNKYDYSKFVYIDSYTKGIIICPEHGEFLQIPNSHIKGRGCPKCAGNNYLRTKDEFVERATKIHGQLFSYNKVTYKTCKDKVLLKCNKCGSEFYVTPDKHLNKSGCPHCKLVSQNKLYTRLCQSFPDLEILFEVSKNKLPWLEGLRLDIYFPKSNIAIEYNGKLHYVPIKHFGGELGLKLTLHRDSLKLRKCELNNCTLYFVKYDYTEEYYNNLVEQIKHKLWPL